MMEFVFLTVVRSLIWVSCRCYSQHLLLLLPLFVIISFIFYYKNRQNKNALSEAQHMICQLKEVMRNKDDIANALMVEHFDIVKQIALLGGYLQEEEKGKNILKKVNRIVYKRDCFDWEVLYQTMNQLHEGYLDKIKPAFPHLSELEYKICCLTKSKLNNTEIAIILESNVNIIQIQKTTIRKKLKILKHGDIAEFMDTVINEVIE